MTDARETPYTARRVRGVQYEHSTRCSIIALLLAFIVGAATSGAFTILFVRLIGG